MSRIRRQRRYAHYMDELPGLFDMLGAEEASRAAEGGSDNRPTMPDDTIEPLDDAALERPERLRFISFGSGSSGNCAYIGTPGCGLLIDAGVDNNRVLAELRANAIDISTVRGILLTHDHGDHVRYSYAILRHNKHMRLYATPKTINGLLRRHNLSRRISDYHAPIYKEFPFTVGTLKITAFETSHDGSDNVGFAIEGGGTCFVVATDTGTVTERADYYIRQASHLMIESNYDADMLRRGPYPEYLKARIASDRGHLDNARTAEYLASMWTPQLKRVFLCHLSHENNTPETALATVRGALASAGITVGDGSGSPEARAAALQLEALPRLESSALTVLH